MTVKVFEKHQKERAAKEAIRKLADHVLASPYEMPSLKGRWGVVTAVVVGPPKTVTCQIDGSTVLVPGLRYGVWYTPTVADVVFIIQSGSDLFVMGTRA